MATQRQDFSFPGSLANINPAEQAPEAIEKYKTTLQEQIGALERRYDQPNWFKVAAGFAKPQLGGFLASIGSASEALGQNVEQQREQQLPIAQMKAQIEQANMLLGQKQKQNDLFQEWRASGKPMDENTYTRIASLGTDTDVAKAAKQFWDQTQARLGAKGKEQEFIAGDVALQKAVLENPALVIDDPNYTGRAKSTPEQSQQFTAKVLSAKPDYIKPADWASMTIPQKLDIIAEYNNKKMAAGMAEGEKFALESGRAHDVLDELSSLRTLAVDPKLAPLFALGRSGDLFSQFRAFLEKTGGNTDAAVQGLYAAALERLSGADVETKQKADKLIKGIAEVDVRLRGTLNNPTDAASTLSSARSPSLMNSQAGFVGILDQLGLNAYRDIGVGKLHSQLGREGVTAKEAAYSDAMEKFRSETRQLRRQLASQNALSTMPDWYDTRMQTGRPSAAQPAPSTGAAPVLGTTPANPASLPAASGAAAPGRQQSGAGISLSDIEAELARRRSSQRNP